MGSKKVEFLIKLRNVAQLLTDATNEYLYSLATPVFEETHAVVEETAFNVLKFETLHSEGIGEFEVAYEARNIKHKWRRAYSVLKNADANLEALYHGEDYIYGYWLYGEGKIYRRKLKLKHS